MAYRFERLDIATTPDQLMVLLENMERRQFDSSQYIAAQCYDRALGPPMPRGIAAPWYDDFDPNQLYLPFAEFIPVEVQSIHTNLEPGDSGRGWVVCYTAHTPDARGRSREILFNYRQTYEPARILSLSVFKRTTVERSTPRPFAPEGQPRVLETSEPYLPTSPSPSEIVNLPGMRDVLLDEVSRLAGIGQPVDINASGVFFSIADGNTVAALTHAAFNELDRTLEFRLTLTNNRQATLRIRCQEAASRPIR